MEHTWVIYQVSLYYTIYSISYLGTPSSLRSTLLTLKNCFRFESLQLNICVQFNW